MISDGFLGPKIYRMPDEFPDKNRTGVRVTMLRQHPVPTLKIKVLGNDSRCKLY